MRSLHLALVASAATTLAACSSTATPTPTTPEPNGLTCTRPTEPELAALIVGPAPAPIPFLGSDGLYHLVYELPLTNAVAREITVTRIQISGDGAMVRDFSAEEVAARLEPLGTRSATGVLGPSTSANMFVALTFASAEEVPDALQHTITITAESFPDGRTQGGCTMPVDHETVVPVLGSPLAAGERYIAADSCCNAVRHTRAPIVLDGQIFFGQRYAVDWEQVDAEGRFVVGDDPSDPADYAIYGTEVIAAGAGEVVHLLDGLPDQVPGELPTGITFDQVDGNSVVIDHGDGTYGFYAHMQAGSLRVALGDRVERGQTLGLVGNSGNTSAPHLHFHVMDGPNPLASNGLPYLIDSFEVTGNYASTAIFDEVENTTNPLPIEPTSGDTARTNAMPLDLSVITLSP